MEAVVEGVPYESTAADPRQSKQQWLRPPQLIPSEDLVGSHWAWGSPAKMDITQLNELSRTKTKGFKTWLEKVEIVRQAEQK